MTINVASNGPIISPHGIDLSDIHRIGLVGMRKLFKSMPF
jgi:hypothetical protein